MLVYRGGGVKINGCRVMAEGDEDKSCRRVFGGGVGMERPDGDVDDKHIWI